MKRLLITLATLCPLALFTLPAWAVCTSVERISDTEMCFNRGAGPRCVQFANLQTGNRNSWAVQLTTAFQSIMETRIPLTEFDISDEARFVDPHREDFYHGDVNGVHHHDSLLDVHLIARCDVITVTWNGTSFDVSVRNARRTHTPEGDRR